MVSTVTATGQAIAKGLLKKDDLSFYLPLDYPGMVGKVLRTSRPRFLAIIETELWPNLIREADRQGVPVVLLNGRISDRSFPRYLKLKRFLPGILSHIRALGMQSELDAERIVAMGADPKKVFITGNLKYDSCVSAPPKPEAIEKLRGILKLSQEASVWVAGSTHPGEESVLVKAHAELLRSCPGLVLIIAPRQMDRAQEIAELGRAAHLTVGVRSQDVPSGSQLIVLDSMGELFSLYGLASWVFMGKSLFPDRSGGQNPIEPALLGKPVLFGPHMQNFREVADKLIRSGGALPVAEEGRDLCDIVQRLIEDPDRLRQVGENGRQTVLSNLGAAQKSLDLLVRACGPEECSKDRRSETG
jgi:3-deoxy-D-manno-octulosonic-acid transferase